MGEYSDVKRRDALRLLQWLVTLEGFSMDSGSKHQLIIRHETWLRPFPISFRRNRVSKEYIKDLMKLVVATGACTKEEFDSHL